MNILKKTTMLAIGLLLSGCEEVIDNVDLNTAAPRLVIDASIDWEKNTAGNEQKIKLSTTTDYYSETFPAVSGANVVVTNSAGAVFDFIENPGTGQYICTDFEPVIGESYTLTIHLNGETYSATETLIATPDIEDRIEQNNEGGMGGDEVEITYYYQDDGAQINYYLSGIMTYHVAFPLYDVEDDENNQGNLSPTFYSHEDLAPGDIVMIRLYGISRKYFDYFNKLLSASGNNSSPFPTTPNAVRGNIVNQTNSSNFAFGYFRLSEVSTKNYTIQ